MKLQLFFTLRVFSSFDHKNKLLQACLLLNYADSSDDSYVSAGEDPMEAPVFEFPLQDTVVSAGADVLLKCIIAGTPIPEGKILHFVL